MGLIAESEPRLFIVGLARREDFDRDERLDGVEPILKQSKTGQILEYEDVDGDGKWDGENVDNAFLYYAREGEWPTLFLARAASPW